MIKLEFPADRLDIAAEFGRALTALGQRSRTTVNDLTEKSPAQDEGAVQVALIPASEALTLDDAIDNTSGVQSGGRGAAAMSMADIVKQDTRVDTKNVNFNAAFCGEAKVPFYASGKTKGQWKKLKGVTEEDYEAWYAEQLAGVSHTSAGAQNDAPLDTAGAFGDNSQQNQTTSKPIPKDCGEFMGWVSNQQAGGHLNQIDITEAYAKLKLQVTDLFPPNTPEVIAGHVKNLFAVLGGLE